MTRSRHQAAPTLSKTERQYHHIVESYIDKGFSYDAAVARAAPTANKQRAKRAREGTGPKLVGKGGGRQQFYPGKRRTKDRFFCLKHNRRFKSKAGQLAHFRGREHGGGARGKRSKKGTGR